MCCLRVSIVRCRGRRLAAAVLVVGATTTSMTAWSQIPQAAPPTGTQPAGVALQAAEAIPPRTISDIAALLDQHKPDPARRERLIARAKAAPPNTNDRDTLAEFYWRRASAAAQLGLLGQQVSDLRRALELYQHDPEHAWLIARYLYSVEFFAGNFVNARRLREQMLGLRGTEKRRGRNLRDELGLASTYLIGDDLSEARRNLRNADAELLKMARSRKKAKEASRWEQLVFELERTRAQLFEAEGKLGQAETSYRKALDAAERFFAAKDTSADGAENQGGSRDVRFWYDRCESALAENLMSQGRLAEAEIAVRNVLRRSLSRDGRESLTSALSMVSFARILSEQGRYADAARMAQAAVETFEHIGVAPDSVSLVRARNALGSALVLQLRWQDAIATFERIQNDLARDSRLLETLGRGNVDWALALIKTGRAGAAVPMLEQLVKRTRERVGEGNYQAAEQRGFLAVALAEAGQRGRAFTEFQESVKVLIARGRGEAGEETRALARAWRLVLILEAYIKLLYDDRSETSRRGLDPAGEAFRVADAARGQSTQRALAASAARAGASNSALANLVRSEQDTQQQIAVLYSTLLRLLDAPADQQLPQVVAQMRARIQELERERRALLVDLEKRFPAYVNLISPQPATVAEARAALREGEALVSVLIAQDRTYVWAVPKQGQVAFHAANLGEKELGRRVASLRWALDPGEIRLEQLPEFDVAGAYRLYAEVLKPVGAAWKGAHTLMVVANGPLAQLPFAVLPSEPANLAVDSGPKFERYKQVPWLVKQVAIAQLPAVNTLVTLRALPQGNTARGPFIGYGDPNFGKETPAAQPVALRMRNLAVTRAGGGKSPVDWMPYSQLAPLPDTREEILAIAAALKADLEKDVFLGAQASKQNVKAANLSNRRIVAFATHGLIPGDFPNLDQPALALSAPDGKSETGLLTLEDILGLKLDADWVVLSACNTAAGDGQGAEAISGLGRGFFYAGSRALLVTHWPVETRSARALVTEIFQRYAADPALTRAEALRQASLSLMGKAASEPASGKPVFSYAHPLFWAPYALVGDGGR